MTKGNKKLSTDEIIEEGYGFRSKDYKGYKPYTPTPPGYDWRDDHEWEWKDGVRGVAPIKGTCHGCDHRKCGCCNINEPRYYCHRNDKYKDTTKQVTLGEFK